MAERTGRFERGDRRPRSMNRLGKVESNRVCSDNDEMLLVSRQVELGFVC
jgi:hypothetical protein